jgi:hypothetical protein
MEGKTLESALADLESTAERALGAVGELARLVKRVRAAAQTGKIADIERSVAQLDERLSAAAADCRTLGEGWQFDTRGYFASGDYLAELLAAIEQEDLRPAERDGRILSYPSIVRVLPGDQTVEIDRKKERRVRPRVVAAELKKRRDRRTGIRPEQMIEILFRAWSALVVAQRGSQVVRAAEIFDLLTQLPQAREYSQAEFARDLLQLDMSEVRATKAGRRLELRADAGAKRGAVFSAVTPDGEVRLYSGVEFLA